MSSLSLRKIFASPALQFPDFRFLWLSSVFNSIGFIGEQVIVGWIILEMTDSSFMVGSALALRMVPFLLLGLISGSIADRVDRRKLLIAVSLGMSILSLFLSLVIVIDILTVWLVFLVTFMSGCVRAMGQPARQSFAYDIVGSQNLVNAISYLSLAMRLGGIVGSLLAGILVAKLGADVAYAVLAVSYLGSALTLSFIGILEKSKSVVGVSLLDSLKEAGREIKRNNTLLVILILSATVEILGFSHQSLLPAISRDILNLGAEGLGLLNALRSVGGIIIVLILSSLGDIRHKGILYLAGLFIFGVSLILLGFAGSFLFVIVAIIIISGMGALSDILSQTLVQTVVPDKFRGRAMGGWIVAVGLGPAGHLEIGALASVLGIGFALTAHGGALILLAIGTFLLFPRVKSL